MNFVPFIGEKGRQLTRVLSDADQLGIEVKTLDEYPQLGDLSNSISREP